MLLFGAKVGLDVVESHWSEPSSDWYYIFQSNTVLSLRDPNFVAFTVI
jgi:hypothetical protein